MRLIIHDYEDGSRHIYETTDDGKDVLQHVEGQANYGKRIRAFIELACDNNEEGRKSLLKDLQKAVTHLKSRSA